jgi:hypothetical protein
MGAIHGATFGRLNQASVSSLRIGRIKLAADEAPSVRYTGDTCGRYPGERIKYETSRTRHAKNQAFDQTNRKLAGVVRLFDVVRFDVRDRPNVLGVLTQRITRKFTFMRSLEVALGRILRGDSNRIKVEEVVIRLRIPENDFVPPRKPPSSVETVPESPNDPISKLKSMPLKNRCELEI